MCVHILSDGAVERHMLIVRVLLGASFFISERKTYSRPPCRECFKEVCSCNSQYHDSVVFDSAGKHREFIVYDNSHCYPEYFVTYTEV
jgi:hypothetical protein